MSARYTLGLDYGTNSVRALLVNTANGREVATAVWGYEHGQDGVILGRDPNLARQHPADYVKGAEVTIKKALAEARRAGFDDALMLDIHGRLAEASTANVFVYLDGRLCTPTLETGILEGITRTLILRLAPAEGLAVAECDLYPGDLDRASEVMLTGTVREVAPVVQVDRRRIGSGRPGPVAGRLLELLRRYAQAPRGR